MIFTGEELSMITPLIKEILPSTIDAVGKGLGWGADGVRIRLASTFNEHIETVKRKCSYVRTINYPDIATPIMDIYVNLYVTCGSTVLSDDQILERLESTSKLIITGTAGAGKSMLMRYLLLSALTNMRSQIPLFLELRDFDNNKDIDVLDNIFRLITPEKQRHNRNLFFALAEHSGFCLFLDGLDEVAPEFREEMRRGIDQMLVRYPKVKIIISSRPDVDLMGWESFDGLRLNNLLPFQSNLIIEKAVFFDDEVKSQFLEKLNSGEFDAHQSFLDIALLNVILLMCYGEHLQLSEKFSTFYDQAYEVLYRRHDRTKGLRRKHYSGLAADDFKKVVTAFCFRTYADFALSYTESELTSYLAKASTIAGIAADAGQLSQDMTESVSLLQRDGSKIFFIHRSFQEYFAARFMVDYRGSETFKVFNSVFVKPQANRVAAIVAEIGRDVVEGEWVIPTLDDLFNKIEVMGNHDTLKVFSLIVASINFIKTGSGNYNFSGWSWSEEHFAPRLSVLASIYNDYTLSDAHLLKERDVLVDGVPLAQYATANSLAEFSSSDAGGILFVTDSHIQFQIAFDPPPFPWLYKTDLVDRVNLLLSKLDIIREEAKKRAKLRLQTSVFD